jgi:hypothetical protein
MRLSRADLWSREQYAELSDTEVPFHSGHIGYTFRHLEGSSDAME